MHNKIKPIAFKNFKTHTNANINKGFSIFHFLLGVLIIISVIVPTIRMVKPMNEYLSIKKAMRNALIEVNADNARIAFDKQMTIDNISTIKSTDLEIVERGGIINSISIAYKQPIALYGPINLLLDFKHTEQSNIKY